MDVVTDVLRSQLDRQLRSSLALLVVKLLIGAVLAQCCWRVFYNLFLHPLRHIPGPWLYASSRVPYAIDVITGRLAVSLHALHENYGPVVRTATDEVSFIEPAAWDAIYGRQNTTHREFPKNYDPWDETKNTFNETVFLASPKDHPRIRKALSPAFSDRTLRDIGPALHHHIENFLQGIAPENQGQTCDDSTPQESQRLVDLNQWFSWLAFDLASEFVLGESFHCLTSPEHRNWLRQLSKTWPFISIVSCFKNFGQSKLSFSFLLPKGLLQAYVDQLKLVGREAVKRLNMVPPRPTMMSISRGISVDDILDKDPGWTDKSQLSKSEVLSNAELVVTAGTDTSSTALTAVVYMLSSHPDVMQKVVTEIRGFSSENALIKGSADSTPYLSACITETLRIYAIVPEGLPRICPDKGEEICGYWVPGGVRVQVSPHAANTSSANFCHPTKFIPERWLPTDTAASKPFAGDRKNAFRPFSTGPRNCIGQNFALRTIKMTLCRLLWRHDVKCMTKDNWLDQKSYLLWRRRPLMVELTPVAQPSTRSHNAAS